MSHSEQRSILERIAVIADQAGILGTIDEEQRLYVMRQEFPDGRSQTVYVRAADRVQEGDIVTVYSPCLKVKSGFLGGLSKELAVELLRWNESLRFARFALWEHGTEPLVVASIDLLLETLDPPELKLALCWVVRSAEEFEKRHAKGADDF
jgi:hypothetical protein